MTTSATAAAAAKATKKPRKVSQAKTEQTALPLPALDAPEFGFIDPFKIEVRKQIRQEFDQAALNELAMDISYRGILEPLVVRRDGEALVLVAGERRLRAAKLAALESVPVVISAIDEQQHTLAQIAENIQRQDLSLREEAELVAELYQELGSVQATGAKLHKSTAWVSKRLALKKELGHYATALLADGISEDLELILAVDKLDKATPGSNTTWALCEKIRKGEAGRTEAREALKKATEPKPEKTQPGVPDQKDDPLIKSIGFRGWLKSPWDGNSHYLEALAEFHPELDMRHLEGLREKVEYHRRMTSEAMKEIADYLDEQTKAFRETHGPLAQHEAWVQYAAEKDPFK